MKTSVVTSNGYVLRTDSNGNPVLPVIGETIQRTPSTVVDPFGGIGGFAFHAMINGLRWTGVELEARFVYLCQDNLDFWSKRWGLTGGRIVQGDSRRLCEVLGAAGVAAVVSSPPYEGNVKHDYLLSEDGKTRARDLRRGYIQGQGCFRGSEGYGATQGQLGREESETFWSSAKTILAQCHAILRPGGVAVWVCKDFVRAGKRVSFSQQWATACAYVGFELVEWIHASLVKEESHPGLFGEDVTKRTEKKSFFRRLAEKKGSPRIDHEDVLILKKPE